MKLLQLFFFCFLFSFMFKWWSRWIFHTNEECVLCDCWHRVWLAAAASRFHRCCCCCCCSGTWPTQPNGDFCWGQIECSLAKTANENPTPCISPEFPGRDQNIPRWNGLGQRSGKRPDLLVLDTEFCEQRLLETGSGWPIGFLPRHVFWWRIRRRGCREFDSGSENWGMESYAWRAFHSMCRLRRPEQPWLSKQKILQYSSLFSPCSVKRIK